MSLEIIILAAGQGKRMQSNLPKVLHCIGGLPMLHHLLLKVDRLNANRIHLVVGHNKDQVITDTDAFLNSTLNLKALKKTIHWVHQMQQNGTGHAVLQAMKFVDSDSRVLILNGDTPLLRDETLANVVEVKSDSMNLLTVKLDDPTGMGRILRDDNGQITAVVEEKDASVKQREIQEINTNCMALIAKYLKEWLPRLKASNAQAEIYLTDVIAKAHENGLSLNTIAPQCDTETLGVNSKIDLHKLERLFQQATTEKLMQQGVSFLDASRVDIRGNCQFGNDCVVDVNVILEGAVRIGQHVTIGANNIIKNSTIGDHCVIESNCVIDNASIGNYCHIGPFARIRPKTELADFVKIGNFVETKQSMIGKNSKVNHLSYVGDSTVGKNANIGAGVITCNYDGVNKNATIIGDKVFVGSGSQLVAPVTIAKNATIGAGTTVTKDVEANSLAIRRASQRIIKNWQGPTKK